jgi:hypothetical protein
MSKHTIHQSRIRIYIFGVPVHDAVESFSIDHSADEKPSSGSITIGAPLHTNDAQPERLTYSDLIYTPADVDAIRKNQTESLAGPTKQKVTEVKKRVKVRFNNKVRDAKRKEEVAAAAAEDAARPRKYQKIIEGWYKYRKHFVTHADSNMELATLLGAVAGTESAMDPEAESDKDALGLMQFIPNTWIEEAPKYANAHARTAAAAKINTALAADNDNTALLALRNDVDVSIAVASHYLQKLYGAIHSNCPARYRTLLNANAEVGGQLPPTVDGYHGKQTELALAAYNWGISRVTNRLEEGDTSIPEDSQPERYVRRVFEYWRMLMLLPTEKPADISAAAKDAAEMASVVGSSIQHVSNLFEHQERGLVRVQGDEDSYLQDQYPRYVFEAGHSIFHTGDPVRIAVYDEYAHDYDTHEQGAWYWKFTGYVTDQTVTENLSDGTASIQLRIEDNKRLMKFAQIVNPGLQDNYFLAYPEHEYIVGITADFIKTNMTIAEIAAMMVFGGTQLQESDSEDAVVSRPLPGGASSDSEKMTATAQMCAGVNGRGLYMTDASGIGGMYLATESPHRASGFRYLAPRSLKADPLKLEEPYFPPKLKGRGLREPHLHDLYQEDRASEQVRFSDIYTMLRAHEFTGDVGGFPEVDVVISKIKRAQTAVADEWDTKSAQTYAMFEALSGYSIPNPERTAKLSKMKLAVVERIGQNPHLYPPQAPIIVGCLPWYFQTKESRALQKISVPTVLQTTQTFGRLAILQESLSPWGFKFYANGRGDFVVEMPFRDFDAHDFLPGRTGLQTTRTRADLRLATDENFNEPKRVEGSAILYREDLSELTRSTSDEHVRTVARFTAERLGTPEGGGSLNVLGTITVLFPELMAQHNTRHLQVQAPFVVPGAASEAGDMAAAAYASAELAKAGLASRTVKLSMESSFMGFLPNRPVELYKEFRAATEKISYAWSAASGKMSCSLSLDSTFGWAGIYQRQGGRPLYSTFGGLTRPTTIDFKQLVTADKIKEKDEADPAPAETDAPAPASTEAPAAPAAGATAPDPTPPEAVEAE